MTDNEALLLDLRTIDERLLRCCSGTEEEAGTCLRDRGATIDRILGANPNLADLEELQGRTARLEERCLHWRRTANMELSMIEQHLRFVTGQHPASLSEEPMHLDVMG